MGRHGALSVCDTHRTCEKAHQAPRKGGSEGTQVQTQSGLLPAVNSCLLSDPNEQVMLLLGCSSHAKLCASTFVQVCAHIVCVV